MIEKIQMAARLLLGFMLFIFGLNVFLQFMPQGEMSEEAYALLGALNHAGYFFPLIGGLQIVVGLALMAGRWVALALVLLAPLSVHIILFHLVLKLPNIGPGLVVFLLNLYLLFVHKPKYESILAAK